jgi:hypothetical protein
MQCCLAFRFKWLIEVYRSCCSGCFCKPCLACWSAISFPSIPLWLGTQWICVAIFLLPEIRLEKACISYALRTLLFQKDYPVLQALYRPVQDELGPEDSDTGLLSYLEPSTSQLLNLAIRLQDLVGSNWNIDRPKAHWNPPWNTDVEATVVISSSSKNEAITEHNQLLKTVLNKTTIVAYTDGSQGFFFFSVLVWSYLAMTSQLF